MKIQIKHKFNLSIIFECEAESLKRVVEIAIKQNVKLSCADLSCADLSSADLSSADLRSANLRHADLSCADLRHAHLSSADLSHADLSHADLRYADLSYENNMGRDTIIETGETWGDYLHSVVPALLKAGGNAVTSEAWQCHSWDKSPLAKAFAVHRITDMPALLRPRAEQFIRFFDAGLIPLPEFLRPIEANETRQSESCRRMR